MIKIHAIFDSVEAQKLSAIKFTIAWNSELKYYSMNILFVIARG